MSSNIAIFYRTPHGNRCTGMFSKVDVKTLDRHSWQLVDIFAAREGFSTGDVLEIVTAETETFKASQPFWLKFHEVPV